MSSIAYLTYLLMYVILTVINIYVNKGGGMFKRIFLFALAVLFLASTNVFAGGSGNAIESIKDSTGGRGIGAGFNYDYIDSRLLELDTISSGIKSLDVKNFHQVGGKFLLGVWDKTNIYAKVAGCGYDVKFTDKDDNATIEIESDLGIYTGIGLNRSMPWKNVCGVDLNLGYDIQGNVFFNDVDTVSRNASGGATDAEGTFYGLDGKNSVYLSCKHTIESLKTSLIPYLGVYHSWMLLGTLDEISYTSNGTDYNKGFDVDFDLLGFGPMVGIDIDVAKNLLVNVEGRFVGETAITTAATLKF